MVLSIIITILLLIVLVCLIYIWYLKNFKKYTRERFAFVGVTVMSTLFTTVILQIYSSQGYLSAIINTSNFLLSTKIESYQTDFKDHILTIISLGLLMSFILRLHKNWNGPISETLYNKMRYHENSTMVNEALLQLKDFFSKENLITIHQDNIKHKDYNIFTSNEDDKMPWYENVFELITFSNSQYKIDLKNDYYPDGKCFISRYGLANENIAILCTIDYPKDSLIRNFIHFANSQKKEISKFIIAVKNNSDEIKYIHKYSTDIIVRNENEMLNSLIDFSSYRQFIKDLYTVNEVSIGSNITLKDIYVQLFGKKDNGEDIGEIENYIFKWLNSVHENKHLAILGEYGCGKSVISLKLTYDLLENATKESRIPILIELRGKSPRNLNVTEILSTWATNYRLDAMSLLKLHKAGKLLIIFEGFDEMDMIGDREMRLNHFQRLWEFAIPKSKIIITGRPNFFLDDKELKMNLGIDKPYDSSHFCEAIHLEKFNNDQIKLALRNVDQITRTQVIDILEKSTNKNFFDLVSRPAILFLVAVIWKDRKLSDIKEKINSAVVISEFIKYSYSRQSNKNIHFPLTEKEREYFMLGIAVGMLWTTNFSNQINKNDLENIILKLYRNFPDTITASDNALQPKRKSLKERMVDNNLAEETVLTDVRSCGILVNELSRKDYFKFSHKSFLEYQVSLVFVESIMQDKGYQNIIINSIMNALDFSIFEFRHSRETISFTSEILISKLNLNGSEDPYIVCKRLFSLLYPLKIFAKQPKLAGAIDMYISSRFSVLFTVFPVTMILFVTILFDSIGISLSMSIFRFSIMTLLMFVSFAFLLSTKMNIFSNRSHVRRMSIWLQCCEQLNIPMKIINKVVTKKYILYLKGKIFTDPITLLLKKTITLLKVGYSKKSDINS